MNRFLFLLLLSVALYSCAPDPLCDDSNASNYQDMDHYCQYPASINFYFHPSTLELILDKAPAGSINYIIRPHWKNNSIDINSFEFYSGYIYVSVSSDFKGPNFQIPTDCNYPYLINCMIFGGFYENPVGTIEDLSFTLEYQNEDPIVIWEGEVHFDPSDPCKIIEIIYE